MTLEEAASMLGLEIYSPPDANKGVEKLKQIESRSNIGTTKDTTLENSDIPGIEMKKLSIGEEALESLEPVVQLATSARGTEVIMAVASPRPNDFQHTQSPSKTEQSSSKYEQSLSKTEKSLSKTEQYPSKTEQSPPKTDQLTCSTTSEVGSLLYLDLEDFLMGCLKIGSELARLSVNAVSCGELHLLFFLYSTIRKQSYPFYFMRKTQDIFFRMCYLRS